jgi:hypothetical protein
MDLTIRDHSTFIGTQLNLHIKCCIMSNIIAFRIPDNLKKNPLQPILIFGLCILWPQFV